MRHLRIVAAAAFLLAAMSAPLSAGSKVFLKATGGGSYPIMENLSAELNEQGSSGVEAGYSVGMSIGSMFSNRKWGLELWFDLARYQSFRYENEYESFEGDMTHYNFMLVGKSNLWPAGERIRFYLGAGIGYGYTNISRAGGKIDGFEGMALLQFETSIKDNISFFAEGSFLTTFSEDEFDSSFLEGSAYDRILDSGGNPLADKFTSMDFRVGVLIWLKPPSRYGG